MLASRVQPPASSSRTSGWQFSLEIGCFGPLVVRTERHRLRLAESVRILYASDLHLGHWWTRRLPTQLIEAAGHWKPDVILLGGDLADARRGLRLLEKLVGTLAVMAPVRAVPATMIFRRG
jgi:predicted MPP superfamily phosphohydrolase